jgi:predicted ATPase
MGNPRPFRRTSAAGRLEKDGSNIAQYLLNIQRRDIDLYNSIFESLQAVLPYARGMDVAITQELEQSIYLQMTEGDNKFPGWLLSTGTVRILALFAVLRAPEPPPVVIVEELENGLDPRAIRMVIEEMRAVVRSGTTQVIFTTHSPYLLDMLELSDIVLVERREGEPTFVRPADEPALESWSRDFAPGRLYTMGQLKRREPS